MDVSSTCHYDALSAVVRDEAEWVNIPEVVRLLFRKLLVCVDDTANRVAVLERDNDEVRNAVVQWSAYSSGVETRLKQLVENDVVALTQGFARNEDTARLADRLARFEADLDKTRSNVVELQSSADRSDTSYKTKTLETGVAAIKQQLDAFRDDILRVTDAHESSIRKVQETASETQKTALESNAVATQAIPALQRDVARLADTVKRAVHRDEMVESNGQLHRELASFSNRLSALDTIVDRHSETITAAAAVAATVDPLSQNVVRLEAKTSRLEAEQRELTQKVAVPVTDHAATTTANQALREVTLVKAECISALAALKTQVDDSIRAQTEKVATLETAASRKGTVSEDRFTDLSSRVSELQLSIKMLGEKHDSSSEAQDSRIESMKRNAHLEIAEIQEELSKQKSEASVSRTTKEAEMEVLTRKQASLERLVAQTAEDLDASSRKSQQLRSLIEDHAAAAQEQAHRQKLVSDRMNELESQVMTTASEAKHSASATELHDQAAQINDIRSSLKRVDEKLATTAQQVQQVQQADTKIAQATEVSEARLASHADEVELKLRSIRKELQEQQTNAAVTATTVASFTDLRSRLAEVEGAVAAQGKEHKDRLSAQQEGSSAAQKSMEQRLDTLASTMESMVDEKMEAFRSKGLSEATTQISARSDAAIAAIEAIREELNGLREQCRESTVQAFSCREELREESRIWKTTMDQFADNVIAKAITPSESIESRLRAIESVTENRQSSREAIDTDASPRNTAILETQAFTKLQGDFETSLKTIQSVSLRIEQLSDLVQDLKMLHAESVRRQEFSDAMSKCYFSTDIDDMLSRKADHQSLYDALAQKPGRQEVEHWIARAASEIRTTAIAQIEHEIAGMRSSVQEAVTKEELHAMLSHRGI